MDEATGRSSQAQCHPCVILHRCPPHPNETLVSAPSSRNMALVEFPSQAFLKKDLVFSRGCFLGIVCSPSRNLTFSPVVSAAIETKRVLMPGNSIGPAEGPGLGGSAPQKEKSSFSVICLVSASSGHLGSHS